MRSNRMFVSQETLDGWLEQGQVQLEGDVLSMPGGVRFRLQSGAVFKAEVATGEDVLGLCGKVKSAEEIQSLEGELAVGSVLIGDHAYETTDGFLGELLDAAHGGQALALVRRFAGNG